LEISVNMDASPLSRLPAEIRNIIYELVLEDPEETVLGPADSQKPGRKLKLALAQRRALDSTANLTRTCKAVRKETVELFYAIKYFCIVLPFSDALRLRTLLNDFFDTIGPRNAAALRSLAIDINSVPTSHFHGTMTTSLLQLSWEVQRQRIPECNLDLDFTFDLGPLAQGKERFRTLTVDMDEFPGNWKEAMRVFNESCSDVSMTNPQVAAEFRTLRAYLYCCGLPWESMGDFEYIRLRPPAGEEE
jgi:hypothetical protein